MMRSCNKKIVFVLFASPRPNGNTSKLLDYYLKDFKSYDIVIFDVYKNQVKPCMGCNYCTSHEGCIYNDYSEIDKYLNIADVLVIATPSYNLSFPAPLKAILDRTQIYFSKRFFKDIKPAVKKQKDAFLLLTSGRDAELTRKIMVYQLNMVFSIINARLKQIAVINHTDDIKDIDYRYIEKNIKIY